VFHLIIDKVKDQTGKLDNQQILFKFTEWLKKAAKKRKLE